MKKFISIAVFVVLCLFVSCSSSNIDSEFAQYEENYDKTRAEFRMNLQKSIDAFIDIEDEDLMDDIDKIIEFRKIMPDNSYDLNLYKYPAEVFKINDEIFNLNNEYGTKEMLKTLYVGLLKQQRLSMNFVEIIEYLRYKELLLQERIAKLENKPLDNDIRSAINEYELSYSERIENSPNLNDIRAMQQ